MVRVTSDKKRIGYRNNQIESLRGFAILIIVVYHMFNRFQQIYLESSIRWMDFWGTLGVSTFLMMSSYFLVKPNQGVISFNGALFKFFRKVLRLYPGYVVSISMTFICTQFVGLPDRTVEFKDYLMNIFSLNRFLGAIC